MARLTLHLVEKAVDFPRQPLQHLSGKQQLVRIFHSSDSDDNAIILWAVFITVVLRIISLSCFLAFYGNFVYFGISGELDTAVKKVVKSGYSGLQLLYIVVISVHCCRC